MKREQSIGAAEFKQGCLALLDRVAETGAEYVITKRGRPMARLVPVQSARDREREVLAELRGKGRARVDEKTFLQPTGDLGGWDPVVME